MRFRSPGTISTEEIDALLDVVEHRILPLTEEYVRRGHNLFGGAVLDPETLQPLAVGSNRRGDNPVFHGEIDTILGNLDSEREFGSVILEMWVREYDEEKRRASFERFGEEIIAARKNYEKTRALDDALFGEDYEV